MRYNLTLLAAALVLAYLPMPVFIGLIFSGYVVFWLGGKERVLVVAVAYIFRIAEFIARINGCSAEYGRVLSVGAAYGLAENQFALTGGTV